MTMLDCISQWSNVCFVAFNSRITRDSKLECIQQDTVWIIHGMHDEQISFPCLESSSNCPIDIHYLTDMPSRLFTRALTHTHTYIYTYLAPNNYNELDIEDSEPISMHQNRAKGEGLHGSGIAERCFNFEKLISRLNMKDQKRDSQLLFVGARYQRLDIRKSGQLNSMADQQLCFDVYNTCSASNEIQLVGLADVCWYLLITCATISRILE